ncbi:MAG: DUF3467 domain-containing protein [Actinobacteria bacterium]|nr:DUF3467 domain-containing protein [Actinomycetota bacterium]
MPDDETPEQPIEPHVIIQPEQMAGVWANFAQVSQSPYEFTLDFVRLAFNAQPPNGIVVARVSVSPLFITQLIEALTQQWEQYVARAMPEEVHGGKESGDQGTGTDPSSPS